MLVGMAGKPPGKTYVAVIITHGRNIENLLFTYLLSFYNNELLKTNYLLKYLRSLQTHILFGKTLGVASFE